MKIHTTCASLAIVLGLVSASAEATPAVSTYVRLLVGRTEAAPPKAEVLVLPGTVVLPSENAEQKAMDLLRIIDDLKDSYRLDRIEVASSAFQRLTAGETMSLPSVPGGPTMTASLTAADEKQAVYRVTLKEGTKVLAEPVISVRHGGRAIVGSRDGAAAPYLFVMIESLPALPEHGLPQGIMQEPKLVQRVNPQYPDEARRAKIEGLVLVEATIASDGTIRATRIVRGEPMGLSEAAAAAVKQWRFEPLRSASGAAVEATITITMNFKLS